MNPTAKIYIAGHRGLVGSALMRNLQAKGYANLLTRTHANLLTRTHAELDLTNQTAFETFIAQEKPDYVLLADGNQALVKDYEDFLAAQQWLPIADADFDRATRLRAVHKLRTPDALHLAIAIRHSCIEFWTNDDRLNSVAVGMAVNIFTAPRAADNDSMREINGV